MSIPINTQCMMCCLERNVRTAHSLGTEEQATAFARELMAAMLASPADMPYPVLAPAIAQLFHKHYGLDMDRFCREKEASNAFVLARMDQLREKVTGAADPVFAGLQFAVLGNYIDFSALRDEVSFEMLDEMLDKALEMPLDKAVYASLCADLQAGKKLLYLTDNAGEIGFDRIFAEEIVKAYPHMNVTFCVRGGAANNDATREDAAAVGVPFPVIDNGSSIPGTWMDSLCPEAMRALEEADVIISKGQSNVETMLGCGYNVYYAFLVKCSRFMDLFGREKLTPMLVRDPEFIGAAP